MTVPRARTQRTVFSHVGRAVGVATRRRKSRSGKHTGGEVHTWSKHVAKAPPLVVHTKSATHNRSPPPTFHYGQKKPEQKKKNSSDPGTASNRSCLGTILVSHGCQQCACMLQFVDTTSMTDEQFTTPTTTLMVRHCCFAPLRL